MLSPSLVLLIIEGLSKLIDSKKVDGCLKGVKIASLIQFMHLLFVDESCFLNLDLWRKGPMVCLLVNLNQGSRYMMWTRILCCILYKDYPSKFQLLIWV